MLQRTNTASPPNRGLIASIASTVFGALAAGALWCFVSISIPYDADALIIPLGFALGVFIRWQGFSGRHAMLCAAASTLLGFVYAQYLFGAVRVAQLLGFPLREVLFKVDFVLIANAAWVDLRAIDWMMLAAAMALGAGVAGYRHSQPVGL